MSAPRAAPDEHGLDAFERQLGDLAARLAAIEALGLGDLIAAHRSHAGHLRHLDKASNAIAERAAAAVQAVRAAAAAERLAKSRAAAGERVRIRPVGRALDVWVGPSTRLKLDPQNRRGDSARLMDRAQWLAIVERSDEVRQLVTDGAILVEDVTPDEAARIEARS